MLSRKTRLKTYAPLRRTKPMRRKRPRRIDRETPAERYYKAWIHLQSCVGKCYGPVQQSHERNHTGLGLKENNFRSLAMCAWLHDQWTRADGPFYFWKPETRNRWFRLAVLEYHRRFFAEHGCRPEDYSPVAALRGR